MFCTINESQRKMLILAFFRCKTRFPLPYCYCHLTARFPTFDFIRKSGPVELEVSVLESEKKRQVISVDLGSVCKKQDGDNFYWLERADVAERNKWEVTIKIEFVSGLTASVTSRPFQVTTKVNYKRICAGNWTRWCPLLSVDVLLCIC